MGQDQETSVGAGQTKLSLSQSREPGVLSQKVSKFLKGFKVPTTPGSDTNQNLWYIEDSLSLNIQNISKGFICASLSNPAGRPYGAIGGCGHTLGIDAPNHRKQKKIWALWLEQTLKRLSGHNPHSQGGSHKMKWMCLSYRERLRTGVRPQKETGIDGFSNCRSWSNKFNELWEIFFNGKKGLDGNAMGNTNVHHPL